MAVMVRGDAASDSRVAGSADHRGIPLDLGASLPGARQRPCRHVFTSRVRAMGIRDRPISPGLPWQNGCAERLIGTLRRECLDQMIIFGETHLRRILSAYAAYYNQARTHLGITKRCALASSSPSVRWCCRDSCLGRATSPIHPDIIFGKDRWSWLGRKRASQLQCATFRAAGGGRS